MWERRPPRLVACQPSPPIENWKMKIKNWICVGGEAAKACGLPTITKNLKLKIENWICVGEEAAKTCGLPTITTNWKIENWKFKLRGRGGCQGLWLANHHNQEHNHLSKERVPVSSGDFCRDRRDQRSCKFFCHLCKYFAYDLGRVDWHCIAASLFVLNWLSWQIVWQYQMTRSK